ncbi:MAG: glycosyltransferase family 39 protein [Bacteroidia bacterium]
MRFIDVLKKESVLWVLLISTQLFFLVYAQMHHQTKTADSDEYIYQAKNLFDYGTTYSGDYTVSNLDISLYNRRTPGYPVFLILTQILFQSDFLPILLQCALSILNIFIGYKIFKLISPDTKKTSLYLLFFLFFPSQFLYATVFMSEILFQTSILLCVYYLLKFEKSGKFKYFYIHHLLLALAYLIKPVALFLWLGYSLYSIIVHNNQRVAIRQVPAALFHVLLLGSFFLKNYHQTGIAEYSGIGRKVIINYTMPALLSFYENETYAKNKIDSLQLSLRNESYASQCASIDLFIRQEITAHPIHFFLLHGYGVFKFLLETGRWDLELWRVGYENVEKTPSLKNTYSMNGISGVLHELNQWPILYLIYYCFVVFASIALFLLFINSLFTRSLIRRHKLLLIATIIYFTILSGPSASARFRLPVFPILVILALSSFNKNENPPYSTFSQGNG